MAPKRCSDQYGDKNYSVGSARFAQLARDLADITRACLGNTCCTRCPKPPHETPEAVICKATASTSFVRFLRIWARAIA